MRQLDVIDAEIVKQTLAGKKPLEIGKQLYPKQKPESARVSVTKRLRKATVQNSLEQALFKHNLTLETALKPIRDALTATKQERRKLTDKHGKAYYDVVDVPDMTIRLKAADRVLALLERARVTQAPPLNEKQIQALASDSDEVELQRVVFRQD